MTPELNYLEVLKQRCAHGAFLNYFAKFSQKLIRLAPDKDVPVGFLRGQSRQKLTLIRAAKLSEYLVLDNKTDLWLGSQVREPSDDETTTPKDHVFILGLCKFLNKAGGYLLNDTNYIEKSFSDHPTPRSRAEQNFTAFPLEPPIKLSTLLVGWVVSLAEKLNGLKW